MASVPTNFGSMPGEQVDDLYQSGPSTSDQFIKRWSLTLIGANNEEWTISDSNATGAQSGGTAGPILDPLRITFQTRQITVGSMGTLDVTIYNLARKQHPLKGLRKQFTRVILRAGYQPPGRFGIIFDGNIIDWHLGKTPDFVHTYLHIQAGDGDFPLNTTKSNKSISKGTDAEGVIKSVAKDMAAAGSTLARVENAPKTPLIRGAVVYGMSKDQFKKFGMDHYMQNQELTVYKPGSQFSSTGQQFDINAKTGLVGMAESVGTDGIQFDCLLNPDLKMYGTVRLNEDEINTASGSGIVRGQGIVEPIAGVTTSFGPSDQAIGYFVDPSQDGLYWIIAVEHRGDTRGNNWYSHVTSWPKNIQVPTASLTRYGELPDDVAYQTNVATPNVPEDGSGYYVIDPKQGG